LKEVSNGTCKAEYGKASKGKPARQIMKRLVKENLQGRIGRIAKG
jgi:hypothetical protein